MSSRFLATVSAVVCAVLIFAAFRDSAAAAHDLSRLLVTATEAAGAFTALWLCRHFTRHPLIPEEADA